MSKVLNRFLEYVKVETTSEENSKSVPSTTAQLEFAKKLADEIKSLGIDEVSVDNNGYVMASLPGNIDEDVQTVGFIAHMDTSPSISGKNVKPKVIENYDGNDIILNEEKNIVLSPSEFPELKNYIGETIITTDGTTLLGADDKAGIAEIITAIEYLIENPHIPHGPIKIAFTPDEEIGRGADHFDVEKFNADFAYTVDGGPIGELNYENFNAASAKITIQGTNIHPGSAKNLMINSMLVAMELNNMLPVNERPEYTEGYEGFFHLVEFNGTVEKSQLSYIIRDHDMNKFNRKKETIKKIVEFLNYKYGNIITLNIEDTYYNMKQKISEKFSVIEIAKEAMEQVGIQPIVTPIRGGTDGARLSYMGLYCPNIFTGGHNFHGKYEYIPLSSMEKAVKVILKIIEIVAKSSIN